MANLNTIKSILRESFIDSADLQESKHYASYEAISNAIGDAGLDYEIPDDFVEGEELDIILTKDQIALVDDFEVALTTYGVPFIKATVNSPNAGTLRVYTINAYAQETSVPVDVMES